MSITPEARAEVEARLLSAMKARSDVLACVTAGLTRKHFTNPKHAAVFDVFHAGCAANNGTPIDHLIAAVATSGGRHPCNHSEAGDYNGLEGTSAHLWKYCDSVIAAHKCEQAKKQLTLALEVVAAVDSGRDWQSIWADTTVPLAKLNDIAADRAPMTLAGVCDELVADLRNPLGERRLSVGLTDWDKIAGGLRENELVTVAARPGVGKTALSLQIGEGVRKQGKTVALFSLEMTAKELIERLAVHRGGIDTCGEHAKSVAERIRQVEAIKGLTGLKIFEQHDAAGLAAIEAQCRLLSQSPAGLGLIVIDYLQLIAIEPDMRRVPREQQVADITRRLKLLANSIRVPILLLAQLNRDLEREQREPRLSDLRESGAIEQDSDRVWLLYREVRKDAPTVADDGENVEIMIAQAKCRGGRPGVALRYLFQRPCFRFSRIVANAQP